MSETLEISTDRTERSSIDDSYLVVILVSREKYKNLQVKVYYAIKTNNNSLAKYLQGRDITDEPAKIHMKCQPDA